MNDMSLPIVSSFSMKKVISTGRSMVPSERIAQMVLASPSGRIATESVSIEKLKRIAEGKNFKNDEFYLDELLFHYCQNS